MGVLARDHAQHAEGRGHRVAAAFDGEFDDVLRIEVDRILGEAGAGGVFDALVHRQDAQEAGARQPAGIKQTLQVAQNPVVAVRRSEDAVHEVRAGQVEQRFANLWFVEAQQVVSVGAQQFSGCAHGISLFRVRAAAIAIRR